MPKYNPQKIEKKWQKEWERKKIYKTGDTGRKYYALIEFPYPSGEGLHVGHPRPYIGMDIISRKRRMEGYNVLYPIGWDAFGLPTENYAVKTGIHPKIITKKNTDNFRRQIKSLGISFDWSREINTTDPAYYKWTQWIFLKFFEKGLAYKAKTAINWCPSCKIGLANEEVMGGNCERCGGPTEKREKEQWMLAITKYADRLDKDLDLVDYPERVKIQQRNWIGKSEGAEIEFKIVSDLPPTPSQGRGAKYGYITTDVKEYKELYRKALEMRQKPTEAEEKLWKYLKGNKYEYHFRRQHIINHFVVDFICFAKNLIIEVDGDIHDLQKERDEERTKTLESSGLKILRFKNNEVIKNTNEVISKILSELKNPSLGEGQGWVDSVKVFTTRADTLFGATYVVLAPEHEMVKTISIYQREIEEYISNVEKKSDLERTENKIKTGVELKGIKAVNPANGEEIPIWIADYVLPHYGTGAVMAVPAHDERDFEFAKKYNLPIVDRPLVDAKEVTKKVGGKMVTKYKLRDWIFSRQRYWGEPIPLIFCESCALSSPTTKLNAGWVAVPEKDLPVKLPEVKNYKPTDTGESPLATLEKWVSVKCPKCKGPARRETDVMPNWAGSSWYYLRYCDPKNKKVFASREKLDYWMPVDWYNGGMEHTTLHLLYSRFWHKFLYDLKLVPTVEPYKKRTSHGLILGENGEKMSKSRGNVINPDEITRTYGADTLRLYEMFIGPFEMDATWSAESIIGTRRFLEKVWRFGQRSDLKNSKRSDLELEKLLHQTTKKVGEDIEKMSFNTAVSALMILINEMEKFNQTTIRNYEIFLKLLAPFAPHITEELWNQLGHKTSIHLESWPEYDEEKTKDKEVLIIIQINGKTRAELTAPADIAEEQVRVKALELPAVQKWLAGRNPQKFIYVAGRILNIVI